MRLKADSVVITAILKNPSVVTKLSFIYPLKVGPFGAYFWPISAEMIKCPPPVEMTLEAPKACGGFS